MRTAGFTLLEILIVVAVIGILSSIGAVSYSRWIANNDAQLAAATLTQRIQEARTLAKRGTTNVVLSTVADSTTFTSNGRTYSVQAATIKTAQTLTFQPPYGVLSNTTYPIDVTVQSTRNSTVTRKIRIISMLGKVIIQ
ncbi:pilus assembly FimT family protein [Deinococcus navajonensis]|uniref:Tfp pilus assembly protein FimT/FimU n=1 Tax=Deinococcus navajonensis TaxID=309884 RepID=A0ABV8XSI9_9DEIO